MSDEPYVIADIDGLKEPSPLFLTLNEFPTKSCMTFCCDKDTWFMRIRNNKFEFNEERFPDMAPSDFAMEFLRLLKITKIIKDYEAPPL